MSDEYLSHVWRFFRSHSPYLCPLSDVFLRWFFCSNRYLAEVDTYMANMPQVPIDRQVDAWFEEQAVLAKQTPESSGTPAAARSDTDQDNIPPSGG